MEAATETFTCENCGGTFPKVWSDEEAAAEAEELFPGLNVSDPGEAGLVCDGCFQIIMAAVRAEEGWRCYLMPSGTPVHVRPGCRCKG